MLTFIDFLRLFAEERQPLVPVSVLQSYDHEFRQGLSALIQRTQDPVLKQKFIQMVNCPVRDARGNCRGFSEYILSALIKNGIQNRYEIESALSYVAEKMLMPTSDSGDPRETLFGGFDEAKPYTPGFNPLQARFMQFLKFAVNNIRKGKIPRLSTVQFRPQGTVSIGVGRRNDDDTGTIAPEEIPARTSDEGDFNEMVEEITELLRRKEPAYGVPLVGLFQSIIAGQNTQQQRVRFGDRVTKLARPIIVQVIRDYAQATKNYSLLSLLDKFKDFRANQPTPGRRVVKTTRTRLPEKERDFASILSVLERLGRPAGSADLGRYRRRWLEYPPRNPASGFRNRLEEVLDAMTKEGVLRATRTIKGAFLYAPGPNAEAYKSAAG